MMLCYNLTFFRIMSTFKLSWEIVPVRKDFKTLRLRQFDRLIEPLQGLRSTARPAKGWIRAVREAAGISGSELARRLGTSRQSPLQLEKAEAEDRITLKSLRAAAEALDCDLVYALLPKAATMKAQVENRARREAQLQARELVSSVEHSMTLEDQAAGGVDEAIAEETQRTLAERGAH
jgi:predicted DNA-binding mobile mystery protein A